MSTRVVITGIGAVTPLGVGAETLHERAVASLSGLNDENENGLGGKVGRCLDFDVKNPLSRREMRRMDRYTQLAVAAADEAIAQAGWGGGLPCDARRITCYIGTAIGGLDTLETQHLVMHTEGAEEVSPLTVPMMMANAAPAHISMRHGLHGETTAIVTACSSGAQAIIAGVRSILLGEADAAVVGGAEAGTTRFTRAIFNAAGAISPDPTGTRPPSMRSATASTWGRGQVFSCSNQPRTPAPGAPRYWAKSQGTGSPQTLTTLQRRTRTASMRPMPSTVRLKPRGQPPSRCRM